MSKRADKASGTYFHVYGYDSGDVAVPLDLISTAVAKRHGGCSCSSRKGVFFKERGVAWRLESPIVVSKWVSTSTVCHRCLIENLEPVTHVGPRGRQWTSSPSILILAKDNEDLFFQVKLWKSGHRLLTLVQTKYGEVAVLGKYKGPDGEDYVMRCPHCNKRITLSVAAEDETL